MSNFLDMFVTLQNHMTAAEFSRQTAEHHASGPGGAGEIIIVVVGILITIALAYYTVKWMLHPGETRPDHIKRKILNGDGGAQ